MKAQDRREAAAQLRALLDAVDGGVLEVSGQAAGIVRQMEGAATALETLDGTASNAAKPLHRSKDV